MHRQNMETGLATLACLCAQGPVRPSVRVCVCMCVWEADSKVYLRWTRQLSFLGEDECQTFEVSTISVFMPRLWRKETVWLKKQNKTVVTSVHLSHVLRLAFPLMQSATVYPTHLCICLEMGRFGINPTAAHLGRFLSARWRFDRSSVSTDSFLREMWQQTMFD